jgi:hypothetical protein
MPVLDTEGHVSPVGQTTVPSDTTVPGIISTVTSETRFSEKIRVIPEEITELPREILFAGSIDPRIRFREALRVRLYRDCDTYIAYAPELEEFGTGDSPAFALDDLGKTVAESFLSMEDMRERLGVDLQEQLSRLHGFVELRRPA